MWLTQATDYGIRFILLMAERPRGTAVDAAEIIRGARIGSTHLQKVAFSLQEGKLIERVQGKKDRFCLRRGPESISLYDIILSMEGTLEGNQYQSAAHCGRNAAYDRVQWHLKQMQDHIVDYLKSIFISDLLEGTGNNPCGLGRAVTGEADERRGSS